MIHHRSLKISVLALCAFSLPAWAGDAKPRVFTSTQAQRGKIAYESSCGMCHLASLRGRLGTADELPDVDTLPRDWAKMINEGGGYVPPLVGEEFLAKWGSKTAAQLADRFANAIKGFPPANTNDTTYLELAAYVLQRNGALAGKKELTAATAVPVNTAIGVR